jgi:hypothetical protein
MFNNNVIIFSIKGGSVFVDLTNFWTILQAMFTWMMDGYQHDT